MVLKKNCYNHSPNNKNYNLKKYKKVREKNEPTILLVRLEDDPQLLTYILRNNIRTDFKKFRSCSTDQIVEQNFHDVSKDENIDLANFIDQANLRLKSSCMINNMSLDFADSNVRCKLEDKLLDVTKTNISNNVEFNTSDLNCNKEKYCDSSSTSLAKAKISNNKKNKPGPASRKNGKIGAKIIKNEVIARHKTGKEFSSDDENYNAKKDFLNAPEKKSIKRKIISDIEEPLSLISKLTGCQVSPNKVKVLPVSCCVSNNQVSSTTTSSKNIDQSITKTENLPVVKSNGVSPHSNVNTVSSIGKSEIHCKSSLEKMENSKEEVRTVYDVMDYISVVMPGWNLHILSDTNTFCICHVTRNKSGIPHMSKCIELDDDFNGKVYIHEEHCKKFDGVYNSEDAVVDLIKKIDALQ